MNYERFLRRHAALLLVVPLLAVAFAFFATESIAPSYESTATVVILNKEPSDLLPSEVSPPPVVDPADPEGPGVEQPSISTEPGALSDLLVQDRIIATYLELVKRRPVLESAAAAIGFTGSIDEMAAIVSASSPAETQLIRIRAEDGDPEVAAAIANAVATEFIAASEMELARPGLLSLVDPAVAAPAPFSPNLRVNLALALILGAVGAVALALAVDSLHRSVRSVEDVHEATQLPTLGVIPTAGAKARTAAWASEADSEWTTAFRRLRGALSGDGFGTTYHSLFITSESAGAGKSLLAANLAVAYANAGFRVLLIDLDLHGPTQHQIFGLSNDLGVANQLLDRSNRDESFPGLETHFTNLSVIPAGRPSGNPEDVLALGLPPRLLQSAYERADIVIVDGPAISDSLATGVLPASFDAALMVVSAGSTSSANLGRAVEELEGATNVVGVVLNRASAKRRRRGPAHRKPQGELSTVNRDDPVKRDNRVKRRRSGGEAPVRPEPVRRPSSQLVGEDD